MVGTTSGCLGDLFTGTDSACLGGVVAGIGGLDREAGGIGDFGDVMSDVVDLHGEADRLFFLGVEVFCGGGPLIRTLVWGLVDFCK